MKKNIVYISLFRIFGFAFFLNPCSLHAQDKKLTHDTSYYSVYPDKLTLRFYFSRKYTAFTILNPKGGKDLQYKPNTPLSMGAGITYRNVSLNLAYGFGFLNHDKEKGKARYIDLQGHLYSTKWAVDWYGQFYKRYYLDPKEYTFGDSNYYYQRPDAKVHLVGVAAYRLSNGKRFSYRAALVQNEWQKNQRVHYY